MLCDVCKKTIFCGDPIPDKYHILDSPVIYTFEGTHHPNLDSFRASVGFNCYICTTVWSRLQDGDIRKLEDHIRSRTVSLTYYVVERSSRSQLRTTVDIVLRTRISVGVGHPEDTGEPCPMAMVSFALRPPKDSEVEAALTDNTGRIETLDLARFWLNTCLERHGICSNSHISDYFPTRVISIGDKDSLQWHIHIAEEDGYPLEPYATLSHCWGGSVPLTLTNKSLPSFRQSQPVSVLPQTFRDAINVAKHLGIQYLWIDALCIVQDSDEDWKNESARMNDVYRYGRCNIAASRATNTHDGCFTNRDPALLKRAIVIPQWETCTGLSYELYDLEFFEHQFSKQPLHHRAWVLQERLMGPRQIFFGQEQVFWQCHERTASELWPTNAPDFHDALSTCTKLINLFKLSNPENLDLDMSPANRHLSSMKLIREWVNILGVYSNCLLTFPRDKLVAISGIVKIVQRISGWKYFAGIWEYDTASQLLWRTSGKNTRPQMYRAPTWSWASLDGEICSNDKLFDLVLVDILHIHMNPMGDDTTGQILSGDIQLRGVLFEIIHLDLEQKERSKISILSDCYECDDFIADIKKPVDLGRLFCIPFGFSGGLTLAGLIVEKVGASNAYEFERFGTFMLEDWAGSGFAEVLGLNDGIAGLEDLPQSLKRHEITLI